MSSRFALSLFGLAAPLVVACSASVTPAPGQLMVVLGTDMTPGRDFTLLRMTVDDPRVSTVLENSWAFRSVGNGRFAGDTTLPATVAIVGVPGAGGVVTKIRVEAILDRAVRVVREANVVIPQSGVHTLRMTVDWLCWDRLPASISTNGPLVCPEEKTCESGTCESSSVAESDLTPFDAAQVFGGDAGAGACFDVLRCFRGGTVVRPSNVSQRCSIPLAGDASRLNVAVRMPPAVTRGFCGKDACLVPLDRGAGGWTVDGASIVLPPAVCTDVRALEVVTTTACAPKGPELPACGEWSSATGGNDGNDPTFTLDLREAVPR